VTAPDPHRDREELVDLIAKVFSNGGYFTMRNNCRSGYLAGSHYDWTASRIGRLDGRIVTHYGVWGYAMRIGACRVRVGGIGAVATHGDYRRRGLMAETAAAAIRSMRDSGYHMTVLFGIPDFYHRFGYVRAWPKTTWIVKAKHLPEGRPPGLHRLPRKRWPETARLYNRWCANLTATAVRPTYPGEPTERARGYYWASGGGRLGGYLYVVPHETHIACVDSAGLPETVLQALKRLAGRYDVKEVHLPSLPYASPLAKLLRRGNCRCELGYEQSGGAMIRTLRLAWTLERITDELARRLRNSPLHAWRGRLQIADPRQRAALSIRRGEVRVVRPSGRARHAISGGETIAQLLIGTDEPREIVEAGRIALRGDAERLIEVLFPAQHPMLSELDRF